MTKIFVQKMKFYVIMKSVFANRNNAMVLSTVTMEPMNSDVPISIKVCVFFTPGIFDSTFRVFALNFEQMLLYLSTIQNFNEGGYNSLW